MKGPGWRRFGIRPRLLTPAALTLAAVLVSVVPGGLSISPEATPFFALMAVHHWGIYRPELLPAPVVFALGLAQDGLTGGPLGLFALVLVIVHSLVSTQRRVFLERTFLVEWFGFAFVVVGATLACWLISCVYFAALVDPRPVALQGILTFVAYPCVIWIFARAARSVPRTA